MMLFVFGASAALLCGMLMGIQPAVNAEISRRLASPFAAVLFSLAISIIVILPFALWHEREPVFTAITDAPWWVWLGGLAGAAFVTAGITVAPIIGIALFLMIVVTGQLVAASLADHYALFGGQERPITTSRLLGLSLVLCGVLTFRFGKF